MGFSAIKTFSTITTGISEIEMQRKVSEGKVKRLMNLAGTEAKFPLTTGFYFIEYTNNRWQKFFVVK